MSAHDVWPVRTERLQVRPMTAPDIDAMWEWRRIPDVNRWLGLAPDTIDAFRERYLDPDRLAAMYIVELLPTEADGQTDGDGPAMGEGRAVPIGDIMIKIGDAWAQLEVAEQAKDVEAELGWVLSPEHTGRGYATEAIRAVIDVCFGPLGLRRVHAGCFADNEPSWRLMERLGMRREEFSRKTALHRSGEWLDGMNYGILAEEWRAR